MFTDLVVDQTKIFEGEIPWMYLDTLGNVTCGIGFLVASIPDAISIYENIASVEDVREDWLRVSKMEPGMSAIHYHSESSPMLPREVMESILLKKLNKFTMELRTIFSFFDGYPDSVKAALLDMIYNLGKTKFLKFHRLIEAAKANDWSTCALECRRNKIPEARNEWTVKRFLSCT